MNLNQRSVLATAALLTACAALGSWSVTGLHGDPLAPVAVADRWLADAFPTAEAGFAPGAVPAPVR